MADLFDLFAGAANDNSGFGGLDSFLQSGLEEQEAERKAKEKEKKEKEKAKAKKESASKPDKDDVEVKTFPVMIRARGFSQSYGKEGDAPKKLSDILSDLVSLGFVEAAFGGAYAGGVVFIHTPGMGNQADSDDLIPEGCVVADGMQRMEVTAEAFDVEADELSADSVLERWVENNPIYEGCGLAVKGKSASPVFSKTLGGNEEVELPMQVFYDGECHTITDSDITAEKVMAANVVKHIYGDLPKGISVSLAKNTSGDVYFVHIFSAKKVEVAGSTKTKENKKAVEKYSLPLTVFVATFGLTLELSPSDFDGKEKVTLEEIKNHLSKSYKIFSDKSRKLDSIYIEESNTLSLMFVSGKKGAVRVENLPFGTLTGTLSGDGSIASVSFSFQGKKIPYGIYEDVVSLFRWNMPDEASCRICFDGEEYFVVDTTGTAGRFTVDTVIPKELNTPKIVHVVDVHSHNTMPAIFSTVDDEDEIWPGLFMVVGNLDSGMPSVSIRAGLEGVFTPVLFSDLFEEVRV